MASPLPTTQPTTRAAAAPTESGQLRAAREQLCTAHLTTALVAAAAAVATIVMWPAVLGGGKPLEVDAPAKAVAWAALAYFLVTGFVELRLGSPLATIGATGPARLLAHGVVVLAAIAALARDVASLALLAGLDAILPALMAVGVLVIAIGCIDNRRGRTSGGAAPWQVRAMWLGSQWAAATFLAVTLLNLEIQPVPHGEHSKSAPAASAAEAAP